MTPAWLAVGMATALGVVGTSAVLLTSGPLANDTGNEQTTLAQAAGESARHLQPDGTAADSDKMKAREVALAVPEIAAWLASRGEWSLLWADKYEGPADKGQGCSHAEPCVEVTFYSWKASRGLTAVVDLGTWTTLGPPTEIRAPRLTQQLKEEAIELALSNDVVSRAVGSNRYASNVADFDGYGVCAEHLCALVAVVTRDKRPEDKTNGAGVEVDLVTLRVVLVADHTGVLLNQR